MKAIKKILGYILVLSVCCAFPVMARGPSGGQNIQTNPSLSSAEQDTLLWMREEEKMARDVYLTLYKVWKVGVFSNIAASEQQHMDAILKKIDLYGLVDPALPQVGDFSQADIQALYEDLIASGKLSKIDALIVGATIEDMDIKDLLLTIASTNNLALQVTYQNLLEGSKNHLRTFVGLLQKQGVDYEPQYIGQEMFDAILGV